MRAIDLSGRVFGRLTVEERAENTPLGQAKWRCRCSCGGTANSTSYNLRNGKSTSCGCRRSEAAPDVTIDLTGKTFGNLKVIRRVGTKRQQALWRCRCSCGRTADVVGYNLRSGTTRTCGCGKAQNGRKHGGYKTSEYSVWRSMLNRCYNTKADCYSYYGGRGITVCDRWRKSFILFREDMGRRPSLRHSIERRKNDRGYSPDNCYWATTIQQNRNKRTVKRYAYAGREMTLPEWLQELRPTWAYSKAWQRLRRGLSFTQALELDVNG